MNLDIDAPSFKGAKCAEIEDENFFFPKQGKQEAERLPQLRAICSTCIHERECLNFALKERMSYGFWGGKSAAERALLLEPKEKVGTKGNALRIKKLLSAGKSVRETAESLKIPLYYVLRIFNQMDDANNKGAIQLQKRTKNLSKGSYS